MSGTAVGGAKAAATIKRKYGETFYQVQGAKGGKVGKTGGFYANRELARKAGRLGGAISRRGPAKKTRLDYEGTRDHLDVSDRRS